MINPETINLAALPSISLENRSQLPNVAGIYLAIDSGGVVQYVGRSINIKQRWLNHHRRQQLQLMTEIRLAWIEVSEVGLLPNIENALIAWFVPPLNRALVEVPPRQLGQIRVNLSAFWKEQPTLSEAVNQTGLDRRTLSAAKRGHLDRCQVETLFKLRDFASELVGKKLSLEEICKEEDAK